MPTRLAHAAGPCRPPRFQFRQQAPRPACVQRQRQRHGEDAAVDPALVAFPDQVQLLHVGHDDEKHRHFPWPKPALPDWCLSTSAIASRSGQGIDTACLAVADRGGIAVRRAPAFPGSSRARPGGPRIGVRCGAPARSGDSRESVACAIFGRRRQFHPPPATSLARKELLSSRRSSRSAKPDIVQPRPPMEIPPRRPAPSSPRAGRCIDLEVACL